MITIFGLVAILCLVAIFDDDVCTLALATTGDFSIAILEVLIMFLVALTALVALDTFLLDRIFFVTRDFICFIFLLTIFFFFK